MAWWLLLAHAALVAGCSAPLVPDAREPRVSRCKEPNEQVIASLRSDWAMLKQVNLSPEERQQVIRRYNESLLLLLRRYRVDIKRAFAKGNVSYVPSEIALAHESSEPYARLVDVYSDIIPSADVYTRSLEEHYVEPGLGVPLTGIIPAENVSKLGQVFNIRSKGTVRTLTAVLEFSGKPGVKPSLRLIPRHRQEYVRVGKLLYPLAADFSAPIELYWNLTQVKEGRFLGLLRPQKLRDVTGLSCMEGYNPDKIPVILVHGLMSSAGTFDNLVNRLVSDPEIRKHYQFWYFNYPTGIAWTVSAAAYRKALADVRKKVDPRGRNKNWDRMVVAGHSMGGLITHYSQCRQPWLMLKDNSRTQKQPLQPYLSSYYVDHSLPVPQYEAMKKDYFFHPVKAGMVIYMATPHRGAPLARYRLVNSLTRLVRLPETLVKEVVDIVTLQQDNVLVNPKQMTEWFTSVGQLSPDSYSIRGLQKLAVRDVPTHSIIGDRGRNNSPRSSDGVVPYWSSHIGWGTETIVPADHSVQDIPETADDMKRVLKNYLRKDAPKKERWERPRRGR